MRRVLFLALLALLALPALALGADDAPPPQHALALASTQVWVVVVAGLVPLATYVLNHNAPWVAEPTKLFVLTLVAAVASALTQAINAGDVGFNDSTLQLVVTGIATAWAAHFGWKAGGVNVALGGGSNRQR